MCDLDLKIALSYTSKAKSSKDRNIDFNLTFNQFKKLYLTNKCAYTGVDLEHGVNWSVDRLDNSEGYTHANSVVCEKGLNGRKRDLTINEMEKILKVWVKRKKLLKS